MMSGHWDSAYRGMFKEGSQCLVGKLDVVIVVPEDGFPQHPC